MRGIHAPRQKPHRTEPGCTGIGVARRALPTATGVCHKGRRYKGRRIGLAAEPAPFTFKKARRAPHAGAAQTAACGACALTHYYRRGCSGPDAVLLGFISGS